MDSKPVGRDPYFIQSVAHAADVLRAFTVPNEVLGLREVMARTPHSKGIVFRLLHTLERTGLIEKVGENQYRSAIQPSKARKFKIGFAAQDLGCPFSCEVLQGLRLASETNGGIELLVLDNRYNPRAAQKNAELLVKERCDLVIEFQTDESVAPLIAALYRDAKIPFIAVEVPHPGATFFGANNFEAGLLGGRALAKWAKQHWNESVDEILLMELPRAGSVPRSRLMGTLAGIRETLPKLENCPVNFLDGDGRFDGSWKAVRKHLANCSPRRTLISGINDASTLGALRAFEEAGRAEYCAAVGQNGGPEARNEIRRSSRFIGSVAYFPEHYGEELLRLALGILQHKATPPAVFMHHELLTSRNLDHFYANDQVLAQVAASGRV